MVELPDNIRKCIFLLGCALLLVSCSEGEEFVCDLWTASAIVSGRATDATGAPVAQLELQIWTGWLGACDLEDTYISSRITTTEDDGTYRVTLTQGNQNGVACIMVVEPTSSVSISGEVEFVGGCKEARPPGEVNLDLVVE